MRTAILLSLLLSLPALAQVPELDLNFPCKEAMEKDLARRKKRIRRLEIAGIVIANTIAGLPIGFTLAGTAERNMRFHRYQEQLIKALGLSKYSTEEIIEDMRKRAIAEGTVFAIRAERLNDINRKRYYVGFPPMTKEEFEKLYPLLQDLPSERSWTEIQEMKLQVEYTTGTAVPYDKFVELLRRLRESDELCRDGKVERVDFSFFRDLGALIQ